MTHDRQPSFPRSLAGFLRPGPDTGREDAAGTTALTGALALGTVVLLLRLAVRHRRGR